MEDVVLRIKIKQNFWIQILSCCQALEIYVFEDTDAYSIYIYGVCVIHYLFMFLYKVKTFLWEDL